ncbi:MAG: Flp pilus assembly protein CpaB [Bdellovibrionota bacterium]
MKNRRALTFAILLGVLSFFFLFFYVNSMEKRYLGKFEQVGVLVAKNDIVQFEVLDETMLEIRQIPKPYVQPLAATAEDLGQVLGYVASNTIKKGEQIVKTKLNLLGEEGISPIVPKGFRACTVSVNEVTGVGGHIRNGDTVDIIGTFKTLTDKRVTKGMEAVTLFQNVPVIATGKNYRFDPRVQANKTKGSILSMPTQSSGFSTVTLQVTPRMCMDLSIAQQSGTLTLALRSFHDRFSGDVIENLKKERSTTESVTGIKEPIQIKETPQWLEQRGDQSLIVP